MRMWMVDPSLMCDRHLMGEHVECHILVGSLQKGRSISGFIKKDLLEPSSLISRHERLAQEMLYRGFNHKSVLPEFSLEGLPEKEKLNKIDIFKSHKELKSRCSRCRKLGERKN